MTFFNQGYGAAANDILQREIGKSDVWNTFSQLATQYSAINLGQGFPNFPVADFIKVRGQLLKFLNFNLFRNMPQMRFSKIRTNIPQVEEMPVC